MCKNWPGRSEASAVRTKIRTITISAKINSSDWGRRVLLDFAISAPLRKNQTQTPAKILLRLFFFFRCHELSWHQELDDSCPYHVLQGAHFACRWSSKVWLLKAFRVEIGYYMLKLTKGISRTRPNQWKSWPSVNCTPGMRNTSRYGPTREIRGILTHSALYILSN